MQAKGLTNDARYHQMVYMLQQAEQRMNNPQVSYLIISFKNSFQFQLRQQLLDSK